jgi:uncharacterized circularly permuted ATP-grasp superfamily protein/uncharacterized alpha-E superfamily protein
MKNNLAGYATAPGAYDEMWDPEGRVRPHWEHFLQAIERLGGTELEQRRQEARRLLRENGVTYHVHGDPHGLNRPWELDPIPLLIRPQDWAGIEAGLAQRAELLNLLLADLYGPRHLLREGLLPAELVYAHTGFLRPCDQVFLPGKHQLLLYAVDLARGPDGRWWVLGDRTQAPSGSGYALENRTAMTRALPGLFRDSNVRRLASFFQALRAGLVEVASQQRENPRVVVLTPGPRNETYFEHAYLAAYLGYTLVQGDDLTVRDGAVWLKSLDGLKRVEVILRRVDDLFCDPLELRPDSLLGVPGLLEAVRRGNVAVANPLGSGVLENPGLLPFLPAIARRFLDQELLLPGAATWWCGQPRELDYVLEHLPELVLKPIFRPQGMLPVFGSRLSRTEQEEWRARLRARPHLYVGQESLSFSTTPALVGGRLEPRHAVLRTFAVARAQGYAAMPGGLTRSAPAPNSLVVAQQAGGISKDTWVLATAPEPYLSLWLQPGRDAVAAQVSALPSRAAENLFWVGRYAERAEGVARLLRTVLRLLNETKEWGDPAESQCLRHLLHGLALMTGTFPGKEGGEKGRHPEEELRAVALDGRRPGSLSSTLNSLVQAAFAVRDRWSGESWRVIDDVEEQLSELQAASSVSLRRIHGDLDLLLTSLAAFAGLNQESMTRELGWILLDSGRRVERGLLLIGLLRATLVGRHEEIVEHLLLEAVLAAKESLITHRRRYRSYLLRQTVFDLLLLDQTNPRSLAYQLNRLQQHLKELPGERDGGRLSAQERLVLEAYARLRLSDGAALARLSRRAKKYRTLEGLLAHVQRRLEQLSDSLTRTYFSHTQEGRPLAPALPGPGQ